MAFERDTKKAAGNILVIAYTLRSHGHEKLSASSVRAWRTEKKKNATAKRKIDYSDIPPLSDRQLASLRRVGRPPLEVERRQLIAIRLDPTVLHWVKSLAAKREGPYQSLINDLLAGEMKKTS